MSKMLIYIFAAVLFSCSNLKAADAVSFLISIHQKDKDSGSEVLVYSNRAVVTNGVGTSAFLTGFSVDLEITGLDSQSVEFQVHTVTLGQQGKAQAKKFKSEFELPAKINNIQAKPGAFYSLTLVPESLVTVANNDCNYNHNKGDEFTIFPSANFDLQFLKTSLANYHAPSIKILLESEYRAFRDKFHFNITSKPVIYCFPCPVHSVIWDFRFGTAIDPTRNNGYALYHTGLNTADPFVLIHTAILRSYGYAPIFLTEGWAGYYTMAMHKMKMFKHDKSNLPLAELLQTKKYLDAEPQLAEATAATFVRYLIDQYTISKFKHLYEAADDVNLSKQIETIYEKSIATLENEWLNYIDTTTIPDRLFGQFAQRAEQMFDYPLMLEYAKLFAELAQTHKDSVLRFDFLARANYFNGAYYAAVETQLKLAKLEPNNMQYKFGLATFRMMNGELEKAYQDLLIAKKGEYDPAVVEFNLALNWMERGDSAKAQVILEKLMNSAGGIGFQGEARTLLGYILRNSNKGEVKFQAQKHFTTAIAFFNEQIQSNPVVPTPYMWTGIALMGLNDFDNAYEQLMQARFLESRPFYIGMINLWLGKVSDMKNQRELASEYYSEVLAIESAAYHQNEARQYLEKPYQQ